MGEKEAITRRLAAWSSGDREAFDELLPVIEGELRKLARSQLRRERPGHTLQSLDLVNEAYMRLVDQKKTDWHNRAHFFAIAARVMRRVLLDHARKKQTQRRGGDVARVAVDEALDAAPERGLGLIENIALHDALATLEEMAPRQGRVVELRVFGGLTVKETAEVMAISPATVKREWETARAWLGRELEKR